MCSPIWIGLWILAGIACKNSKVNSPRVGQSPQTDLNFLEAVSLSKELSGLLAQQGDMVNHLVALQVHAAAQVTTMR